MSPSKRPESEDPILILTPEDYRRFSTPPEPPQASPRPHPPRRSRGAVVGLLIVVLMVAAAAQVDWSGFRLAPEPAVAVRIPRRIPKADEAPPPTTTATRAVLPLPEIEPEDPPAPASPAVVVEERKPWNGGRAWARIRLRVVHSSRIRESEHRVTLVWDGSRFVLERRPSDQPDAAIDRLELLLHLPSEDGSWRRQITDTGADRISVRSAELACRRVEGEDRFPQGSRRFRYWYSDAFPAGAVQAEQTVEEFTFVARVLEFGAAGEGER